VPSLPIYAVLPELLSQLRTRPNAVLVAPPGAGKTTAVAPALLSEPWCAGEILLLSPRRIAAHAAAERMAELAGERVGETIGYATRMDSKNSHIPPSKDNFGKGGGGLRSHRRAHDPELLHAAAEGAAPAGDARTLKPAAASARLESFRSFAAARRRGAASRDLTASVDPA
jgi:ATP-dependent helicase HrpB